MANEYKVGMKVALISGSTWGSHISTRTVYKVRKDGKFFVSFTRDGEIVQSDQMWSPGKFGTSRAYKSGRGHGHSRERIEIWTEEHDRQLAENNDKNRAENARDDIIKKLNDMDMRDPDHRSKVYALAIVLKDYQ